MAEPTRPITDLFVLLKTLNGQPFENYAKLLHTSLLHHIYLLRFVHIQGSPGVFPASVCHLILTMAALGLEARFLDNNTRKIATADYLLRAFADGVGTHACQNRGTQGSGSYQPIDILPQILQRNLVMFHASEIRIAFHVICRAPAITETWATRPHVSSTRNLTAFSMRSNHRLPQMIDWRSIVWNWPQQ